VSKRYKAFKESIDPKNRSRVQTNQAGIVEEYKMLVDIRSILDEINILQPVFDEQHLMTRRLLKWVDSKTVDDGNGNTPNGGEQAGQVIVGKGLKKWEDFAVSDQTEILKQRVQWLEKDAQRVLNSV
jgi:hypothetical protein